MNYYIEQKEHKNQWVVLDNGVFHDFKSANDAFIQLVVMDWSDIRLIDSEGDVLAQIVGFNDFDDLSASFIQEIEEIVDEHYESKGWVFFNRGDTACIEIDCGGLDTVVLQFDSEDFEDMTVEDVQEYIQEQIENWIEWHA